jgi:hypothetical protein
MNLPGILLAIAFSVASCVSDLRAADSDVLYEVGKPFKLHLASDTNLVLCVENNLCSWKPAGEGEPVRLKFTRGLADPTQASLEMADQTNTFLRHFFLRLRTAAAPARRDPIFEADATFNVQPGSARNSVVLRSFNFRDAFIARTHTGKAYVTPDAAPDAAQFIISYK